MLSDNKYLNLSGLGLFLSKLKTIFSTVNHTHNVSSISGVLPISKGGTGTSTANDARLNLGVSNIETNTTEPNAQANGDWWLKEI